MKKLKGLLLAATVMLTASNLIAQKLFGNGLDVQPH